jgi:hypothetical protein
MVKYLSFHNSSFAFKIHLNVNGQGHNVTYPLWLLFWALHGSYFESHGSYSNVPCKTKRRFVPCMVHILNHMTHVLMF